MDLVVTVRFKYWKGNLKVKYHKKDPGKCGQLDDLKDCTKPDVI